MCQCYPRGIGSYTRPYFMTVASWSVATNDRSSVCMEMGFFGVFYLALSQHVLPRLPWRAP
jgi:hypothetical protein